jgi:hypothetical protein
LIDRVVTCPEARHELRRQHRQLVRPDAGGDFHEQDAALERDRVRAIGDAGTDHQLPFAHRDGWPATREAVFTRAIEQRLDRLGGVEVLATSPLA